MDLRPIDPNSPTDLAAALDLFELVYGRRLSEAFYRWRFLENPFGTPLVTLLWDGPKLAGHYSASPSRSFQEAPFPSAQSMTTMTHPDYRNQGVFTKLAEDLFARMESSGREMIWGFPNTQSHYGFVQKLGWRDVGVLCTMTRVLGAAERHSSRAREIDGPSTATTALFERGAGRRMFPNAHDQPFLRWRYVENPSTRYRFFTLPGSEDDAFAVTKEYSLADGRRSLEVVDFLHGGRTNALGDLMGGLLGVASDEGYELVRTWCAQGDVGFPALERLGFVPREPLVYFGARVFGRRSLPEGHLAPSDWGIAMGDSDNY